MARHVGFESWLERDHLMLLDFDPAVVGIASQPFQTKVGNCDAGSRWGEKHNLPLTTCRNSHHSAYPRIVA